jgi:hypothetical protein
MNNLNESKIEVLGEYGTIKQLIHFIYKNEVENLKDCHEKLSKSAEEV